MPERKGYIIENTYQGGPSAFQPTPLASGLYPISSGTLALAQDPRTANVLQAVSDRIASGVKNVEVVMLKEISDAMPKQHLDELNRMSKLTGVDMSIHGPVIDVTGLSQQGFSEAEREMAERKVLQTLQRSHQVDPDSNINVTFHSAEGIPGSQPLAPHKRFEVESRIEPGEKVEIKSKKIIAVDQETGQMAVLDEDTKYYPGGPVKKEILYPEEMLDVHNHSAWDNMLTKIEFNRENIDRIMHDVHTRDRDKFLHNIELQSREEKPEPLTVEEYAQQKKIYSASSYAKEAELAAKSAFDRAYKYGTQEDRDFLDKLSKQYGEMLGMTEKGQRTLVSLDPIIRADALQGLIKGLENLQPKLSVPVDEFALKQSAKTFGNAAFESYKEFKDKSPTLVIENPPAGFGLSTGEDIANIVKESRRQFIEQAEKEGMSKSQAEKQAAKLIGATWDVGHINMLRKFGYTEKEIIAETEKVAPFVKHVHLSDNFGFEHTELPMGMGNVPLKEMMEKLGQKGFEAQKVIEAKDWWQHFGTSPLQSTLEGVGAPIYRTTPSPYWNQNIGFQQSYFSGMGATLPQINYATFGAGFSMLPTELGGNVGGGGGRMGGRGME